MLSWDEADRTRNTAHKAGQILAVLVRRVTELEEEQARLQAQVRWLNAREGEWSMLEREWSGGGEIS